MMPPPPPRFFGWWIAQELMSFAPPISCVEDVSGVGESNHDDVTNANDLRAVIHKGHSLLSWQVVDSIPQSIPQKSETPKSDDFEKVNELGRKGL